MRVIEQTGQEMSKIKVLNKFNRVELWYAADVASHQVFLCGVPRGQPGTGPVECTVERVQYYLHVQSINVGIPGSGKLYMFNKEVLFNILSLMIKIIIEHVIIWYIMCPRVS